MACMVRDGAVGHTSCRVVAPPWQDSGHIRNIGSVGRERRLGERLLRKRWCRHTCRLCRFRKWRIGVRCGQFALCRRRRRRRRRLACVRDEASLRNLGSQGSRWSCKICADPCFVVNLAIAQERQCLDSFAYVSKISQHGIVKQRDASRELKSFAPSMSERTSCVPDGLVLLKVTADTARTLIKDECDSLCTCAVAVHLQKMLVIVCRVRRSHLRTLRHT